jgi:hypothetical protein
MKIIPITICCFQVYKVDRQSKRAQEIEEAIRIVLPVLWDPSQAKGANLQPKFSWLAALVSFRLQPQGFDESFGSLPLSFLTCTAWPYTK